MPNPAFLPAEPPDSGKDFPLIDSPLETDVDETLCYRIELWDDDETQLESVLAVAQTATIAYSAFFAAAKHLPHRLILLRFQGKTLSRWKVRR
jgi:hypothetical protein